MGAGDPIIRTRAGSTGSSKAGYRCTPVGCVRVLSMGTSGHFRWVDRCQHVSPLTLYVFISKVISAFCALWCILVIGIHRFVDARFVGGVHVGGVFLKRTYHIMGDTESI